MTDTANPSATLITRRHIRATPERLFAAWTEPAHLVKWWGPEGVECSEAHVDLRVGGSYRIANRFPDATVVWISGEFETIEPPHRLVYSWNVSVADTPAERVTVQFVGVGDITEVIVTHERVPSEAARQSHERGWEGCLNGLQEFVRDVDIGSAAVV